MRGAHTILEGGGCHCIAGGRAPGATVGGVRRPERLVRDKSRHAIVVLVATCVRVSWCECVCVCVGSTWCKFVSSWAGASLKKGRTCGSMDTAGKSPHFSHGRTASQRTRQGSLTKRERPSPTQDGLHLSQVSGSRKAARRPPRSSQGQTVGQRTRQYSHPFISPPPPLISHTKRARHRTASTWATPPTTSPD